MQIRQVNILVTLVALACAVQAGEAVTELKAFYREGQTFITWKELAEAKSEKYRVYRAEAKIGKDTLGKAELVATLPENSGAHTEEVRIKVLEKSSKLPGYGQRFMIQDNPKNDPQAQLAEGLGLFVHTIQKDGTAFYAVVPEIDGKEQPDGMAALAEGIAEKVATPGAVLVWKNEAGTGAVYTHWMDHAKWKPASEGYAYNFSVATPAGYDGAKPLPVMFYGHGMGESYNVMDKANYWPSLWVKPSDKSGTWFFGMLTQDQSRVENFTEQRLRWMTEWVKAERPNQFWKADPKRYQAHGHSMGGTMCTALGLRMGDVFCTIVSSCGASIHSRNKPWVAQASKLWGPVEKNTPTAGSAGVWDHQDYAKWSLANIEKETAYLLFGWGKGDGSVIFEPVPDFLDALQKSKRPFMAKWDGGGHSPHFTASRNDGMGSYKIPFDESLLAFANASNNDDPRAAPTGQVNGKLEWCAPGNDFDKTTKDDDLVDSEAQYAVNIRSLSGPATADVTPRRLQMFKPVAGQSYAWKNLDCTDIKAAKPAGEGVVQADKHGLITVEKFQIGKEGSGNRLVIEAAKK